MCLKDLFEALSKIDENHFIVIENDCVGLYDKREYLPTPVVRNCN